jgi:hypothetical protein
LLHRIPQEDEGEYEADDSGNAPSILVKLQEDNTDALRNVLLAIAGTEVWDHVSEFLEEHPALTQQM